MTKVDGIHSEIDSMKNSLQKKDHSTETVLFIVLNDVCININHQNVTLLVLLDLSVAFDNMDHDILSNHDILLSFGHHW